MHELLKVVEDLHRLVSGFPGAWLWRRRGEDDDESS
jgi:hypothetical protein